MSLGQFNVITPAKKVMFYAAFVFLSFCLLAASRKIIYRIFVKDYQRCICEKRRTKIKFCKSSASAFGSTTVLKDSATLRDRTFFYNLAHIFGKS